MQIPPPPHSHPNNSRYVSGTLSALQHSHRVRLSMHRSHTKHNAFTIQKYKHHSFCPTCTFSCQDQTNFGVPQVFLSGNDADKSTNIKVTTVTAASRLPLLSHLQILWLKWTDVTFDRNKSPKHGEFLTRMMDFKPSFIKETGQSG